MNMLFNWTNGPLHDQTVVIISLFNLTNEWLVPELCKASVQSPQKIKSNRRMMEQDVIMMQQPQKYFKNPYSYWQFKWMFFWQI